MEDIADTDESISSQSSDDSSGNIKETIESILVAFILAFIFRAFVVEAFVIPTGSMATTLMGAHMRFLCPDCGYRFDVNVNGIGSGDDLNIEDTGWTFSDIYCPNCGYLVEKKPPPHAPGVVPKQPPLAVHYGDRILVLKYEYLLHPPERWDVVVFKSPADPSKYFYAQNYIKRLVGKPGEKLMVLDGDIYIFDNASGTWQIQTKPRAVQEALWRIVYDNDFHPTLSTRAAKPDWKQPWRADSGSGWNASDLADSAAGKRVFRFDNANATGSIKFNPKANSTTQSFTDYLVYDTDVQHRNPGNDGSPDDAYANPVADLKLVAYYQRTSGDGPMRFKLTRTEDVVHTFIAEITPDAIRLIHRVDNSETTIGEVKLADLHLSANSPMLVELLNVDYQCTLRINGDPVIQTTRQQYSPPAISWLRSNKGREPQASIEGEKQIASIGHLSLWRDIYYTNVDQGRTPLHSATPENPAILKDHEYFVMGDNSLVSSDARYWTDKIKLPHEDLDVSEGRVPEQFLLGKAVFVYWPAGNRPSGPGGWAIIPDFADMRWIH